MSKALIGIHVKKEKRISIEDAISEDAEMYPIKCAQIFTHGPRALTQNTYDEGEIKATCAEKSLPLVVHSAYMLTPWKKNKFQIKCVIKELIDASDVGAGWLILHLPTRLEHSKVISALDKIRKAVAKMDDEDREKISKVVLVLEHKAHKPYDDDDHCESYTDSESIAKFLALLHKSGYNPTSAGLRVGFCLDTAHMFVSHEHREFTGESSMQEYLKPLLPHMHMFSVLHFNGSFHGYGSGHDKHAVPFTKADNIWKKNNAGAVVLIQTMVAHNPTMPIIIEWNFGTPKDMKKCFKRLGELGLI